MTQQTDNPLINALLNPQTYPHHCDSVKLVETHISWVFLTGNFVYKIKKPVDFGFLNFTKLDRRHFFCGEEIRLNRRLAPELYLELLPITGSPEKPVINGEGEPFEYLIKMKQFPEENLMDRLAAEGKIDGPLIDRLADRIAKFHNDIDTASPDNLLGTAESVQAPVVQNFEQILPLLSNEKEKKELALVEKWSINQFETLKPMLAKRHQEGFIRECHGDLHLGNIVVIDGDPVLFDCIEFNDEFRWIDVMNEIAFIVMDLMMRDMEPFGWRLLNRYLEKTGDYEGISLLNYYLVYRAMVRAKIARFTMGHMMENSPEWQQQLAQYQAYIDLALKLTDPKKPEIFITHGLSGSGKSFVSGMALETFGLIRIRSDIERKRLAGFDPLAKTKSKLDSGIYAPEMGQKTYARLLGLTKTLVDSGHSVIVDATFLQHEFREAQRKLAELLRVTFLILHTDAPNEILEQFIEQRAELAKDPSEADKAVLARQRETLEPLTPEEKPFTLSLDSSGLPGTGDEVLSQIRNRIS